MGRKTAEQHLEDNWNSQNDSQGYLQRGARLRVVHCVQNASFQGQEAFHSPKRSSTAFGLRDNSIYDH